MAIPHGTTHVSYGLRGTRADNEDQLGLALSVKLGRAEAEGTLSLVAEGWSDFGQTEIAELIDAAADAIWNHLTSTQSRTTFTASRRYSVEVDGEPWPPQP